MKNPITPNSLYLVTDSDLLHKSATSLEDHVEQAILGGVDIVQLREKHAATGDFISLGRKLLAVCKRHNVPLIINDRADVALAIGADGLHIGQDDMSCADARKLLGQDSIIGVSVNNTEEARQAVSDGADYVGIGAVYDTATKALTNPTLGTLGVQEILQYLAGVERDIGTVAIGGLNASNIDRVMCLSGTDGKTLDGVALVSAIMTSIDPQTTSRGLKGLISTRPACLQPQLDLQFDHKSMMIDGVLKIASKIRMQSPLIQQMTNNVVKNFSANVTIAIGASPVMSEVREEAVDLAQVNGAFLLNMGMVSTFDTPIFAVQQNNRVGRPCVLDPVGAGGTEFRRRATRHYLNHAYFDVIKGNESEIRAASGLESFQRGVDNLSTSDLSERCQLALNLARRCHNIVVISGVEDIVADDKHCLIVRCGHSMLGQVTGSGCSLGSTIASCLAVSPHSKLLACIAAVTLYGVAAEHAASRPEVHGPGTFVPAFLDALHLVANDKDILRTTLEKRSNWLEYIRFP